MRIPGQRVRHRGSTDSAWPLQGSPRAQWIVSRLPLMIRIFVEAPDSVYNTASASVLPVAHAHTLRSVHPLRTERRLLRFHDRAADIWEPAHRR